MQGFFKELRWGGWESQVYGYAGKFSVTNDDRKTNGNGLWGSLELMCQYVLNLYGIGA